MSNLSVVQNLNKVVIRLRPVKAFEVGVCIGNFFAKKLLS